MTHSVRNVVTNVVQQHADESAFLWILRDRIVGAPNISLSDLAAFDDRLEAHLDGLELAGDAAWEICAEQLHGEDPGEVFAAAATALRGGDPFRVQAVLEAVGRATDATRPLAGALAWSYYPQAAGHIQRLLAADDAALRRIGIAATAAHRQDPGGALDTAIEDGDLLLRACALRAAGELGRAELVPRLREHLVADDPPCRFAAAWSVGLLAGQRDAIDVLQAVVEASGENSQKALQLGLRRMEVGEAKDWIGGLAQDAGLPRPAVIAAGALGVPELVPWLVERMETPALARVAGEALTMITGVDIAYEDLEGQWPEGFSAGPTEDPEDEDVEMDPDENLPWPDRKKIAAWWQRHRERFDDGTRYLLGGPMTIDRLEDVLRNGRQRQRAAAALELAIRRPGQPLFEIRAPGWRQQQLLGVGRR